VMLVVVGVAWACHGAAETVPDVIKAHSLEIVDKNGKTAANIFTASGTSIFNICDPAKPRDCIQIGASDGGVSVILNQDEKTPAGISSVVRIQTSSDSGPGVQITHENKDGKETACAGLHLDKTIAK
jgi:hypothetical protein